MTRQIKFYRDKNSPSERISYNFEVACLRSCFIFTSFGTFFACVAELQYVRRYSSFKLIQPSNIEVGTCTSLSECKWRALHTYDTLENY